MINPGRGRKRSFRLSAPIALLTGLAAGSGAAAGETPCWIDNGALVAPAVFGDIAGDFLIDLSAPVSALHITRAQASGLQGATAQRDLAIAGQRVPAFAMAIVDLDNRTATFDTVINGVLGADLLGRFIVEIDPSPCRLRLSPRGSPRRAGGAPLTVLHMDGRPLVSARVTDGVAVRQGLFAIDTADWATAVSGARLSRPLPPDGNTPVRLRAVEVAGRLIEQAPAAVSPGDDAPDAIGMAVWSRWRMRLDIIDGWLELSPTGAP